MNAIRKQSNGLQRRCKNCSGVLCKHQRHVYHILGDHLARAVTLSARNRSGNGLVLHTMSPSSQAAPSILSLPISFSLYARGPESPHSLCRQASLLSVLGLPFRERDALCLRQPAWHLLNRATPSGTDSTIWRDGSRRSPVSWTRLTFNTQCDVLPLRWSGKDLLCSKSGKPTTGLYFSASCPVEREENVSGVFFMVVTQILLEVHTTHCRYNLMFC